MKRGAVLKVLVLFGCVEVPKDEGHDDDHDSGAAAADSGSAELCPTEFAPVTKAIDLQVAGVSLDSGWFLAADPAGDRLAGFVMGEQVCVAMCDVRTQSLCTNDGFGCVYCGPTTQNQCADFLSACEP